MGLETLLADEPGAMDQFEEMFLAYAMGLTEGRAATDPPGRRGPHDHDQSTQTKSPSTLADRLQALIAHAVAALPYYREVLGPEAANGDVPLEELATSPKATLMDNFDRVVTDPRLRLAELEAHLAGADADRPYLGRYRVFSTAGTTEALVPGGRARPAWTSWRT